MVTLETYAKVKGDFRGKKRSRRKVDYRVNVRGKFVFKPKVNPNTF